MTITSLKWQLKGVINLAVQVRLGDVDFNVITTEQFQRKNKITDHPVEDNASVSDNVIARPDVIKVQGIIVNTGANDKEDQLQQYAAEHTILTYNGLRVYENVVIETLITKRSNKIFNGFDVTIQLKVIRTATSRVVEIDTRKVAEVKGSVTGNLEPFVPAISSIGLSLAGALTGSKALVATGQIIGRLAPSVKNVFQEARDNALSKVTAFLDFARNTFTGGGDN